MARKWSWQRFKEEAPKALWEDRLIGYLDPGVDELLSRLNSIPLIATTSSCIGRITLIEGEWYWTRGEALIAYKTHDPISVDEIERVAARPFRNLWLKATGPIIHLRTPSIECADHILEVARRSGFKHSGIISLEEDRGYTIELLSAVDITFPLKIDGDLIVGRGELAKVVEVVNHAVVEARARFKRFVEEISLSPGPCA
ncbi:MAG: hypothetical protein GSR85_00320 [Desulfurococcales archaeon]|nr:hypothetical protein [Desulfurococcales archaeon]